jgi:hypothetical protein
VHRYVKLCGKSDVNQRSEYLDVINSQERFLISSLEEGLVGAHLSAFPPTNIEHMSQTHLGHEIRGCPKKDYHQE